MADLKSGVEQLREIVAKLRAPDGCPWDREQTHSTLRSGLVEEAYEVVEAIDRADDENLCEELGDLLLQVVMHAQIASEQRRFDFDQVARGIAEKLVRRHPHVFGGQKIADTHGVLKQWDEIKRGEKGASAGSALDGISAVLPALMRAEKIQKRAARSGFDWPDTTGPIEKLREEIEEVAVAQKSGDANELENEVGDLLFSVVNLSRKLKIDPELALQKSSGKFVSRFHQLENIVRQRDQKMDSLSLAQMDEIWDEVKRSE